MKIAPALNKKKLLLVAVFLMRRNAAAAKLHLILRSNRRRKFILIYTLIYFQRLLEAEKHYENFLPREMVIWRFPRIQLEFDDHINGAVQNPEYWKKNFRMTWSTFMNMVQLMSPFIAPNPNFVRGNSRFYPESHA